MNRAQLKALMRHRVDRDAKLPILDCGGCGACCRQMTIPPEAIYADFNSFDHSNIPREQWPRSEWAASLPPEAWALIAGQIARRKASGELAEVPCCWLDLATMKCRFYEHRPEICQDFEMGGESCRAWRREFDIQRVQ